MSALQAFALPEMESNFFQLKINEFKIIFNLKLIDKQS